MDELKLQISQLTKTLDDLRVVSTHMERQLRIRTALGVGLVVALLVAGMILVSSTIDTSRQIADSEQRWCQMLTLLVTRPGDPPPAGERARRIAQQAQALSTEFHCGGS